ncbi:MAG: Wzz/FepE/Etk N-terminal domain-containing protein [Bacteroidia bacterium]
MENTSQPSTRLDFIGLLKIIFKWKKQLILTGVIAAVTAFVFTRPFIMPPQFKSKAIVYPSNIAPYSTESETETMLQFMQSDEVKNMLVSNLHLYAHYKMDSTGPLAHTYMFEKFGEKIQISRTQYESIEITVWDGDPKYAALLCDSIISFSNVFIRNVLKEKWSEVAVAKKQLLEKKQTEMDSMENALKDLRINYGIMNYKAQAREISKVIYKNGGGGNAFIQEQYKNLKEHGGEEFALTEHLFRVRGFYNDVKKEYDQALSDANKIYTYSSPVTKPVPAEIKDFPKGTLIILGFTAAVLFFALIVIVIIESYRNHLKNQLAA